MKFIINIGVLIGRLSLILPTKLFFPFYMFRRAVVTGRWKGRFAAFGANSMLAPGVRLLTPENIRVGEKSSIMSNCVLETCPDAGLRPEMIIGDGVSLGEHSHITCARKVVIGNGVLTGRFVLITDNAHGASVPEEMDVPPMRRPVSVNSKKMGGVVIGDNVWIGDKVTILPGVTIGKGSIIAANAVVTTDVPPYSVAGGVPAKVLKIIK